MAQAVDVLMDALDVGEEGREGSDVGQHTDKICNSNAVEECLKRLKHYTDCMKSGSQSLRIQRRN